MHSVEDRDEARLSQFWAAPLATKVFWLLQVGVALEFIGHGMAGLWRSPAWLPYYTFFGFSKGFAHDHLYYVTGTVDIALAAVMLIWPNRAVMLHMAFWGVFTAALRPLTGESVFELVERGANYGMPLALLLLSGWGTWSLRSWFGRVRPPQTFASEALARQLDWVMRGSIALLLVGHGGLGIWAHKPEWLDFFGWFGISAHTVATQHLSQWVGVFEIALGLAVLVKPLRSLLLFVLVYKLGTELLRPLVGQNNFQFIERAGDYVLPVTLIWVLAWLRAHGERPVERARAVAPAWTAVKVAIRPPVRVAAAPLAVPAFVPNSPWAAVTPAPQVNGNGNGAINGNGASNGNGNGHGARRLTPTSSDPEVVRAAAALAARRASRQPVG